MRLLVMALVVLWTAVAFAGADNALTPLLVDLDGWQAKKVKGTLLDMGAMKMTSALRNYQKDKSKFYLMFMVGNSAMIGLKSHTKAMTKETAASLIKTSQVDGFWVHIVSDKKKRSGSVVVNLAQSGAHGAVLTMHYENMTSDQALGVARKFNWQAMKKAVKGVM